MLRYNMTSYLVYNHYAFKNYKIREELYVAYNSQLRLVIHRNIFLSRHTFHQPLPYVMSHFLTY